MIKTMDRFKFLRGLIYLQVAIVAVLILKSAIYPSHKDSPTIKGGDDIIFAIAVTPFIVLTLLVYAYFEATGSASNNPAQKKKRNLWQLGALFFILAICFGVYSLST